MMPPDEVAAVIRRSTFSWTKPNATTIVYVGRAVCISSYPAILGLHPPRVVHVVRDVDVCFGDAMEFAIVAQGLNGKLYLHWLYDGAITRYFEMLP